MASSDGNGSPIVNRLSLSKFSKVPVSKDPLSEDPVSKDPASEDHVSKDSASEDPVCLPKVQHLIFAESDVLSVNELVLNWRQRIISCRFLLVISS